MWRNRELLAALLAVVVITAVYLAVVLWLGIPRASGLFGHSLGIVGFAMMLLTESAYSLRKREMVRPRGPLRSWLRAHIFTGIVGPYLVLLHTSWAFNGLAGVLTLMMALVVGSGFIGRYFYTLVPRTADGVVLEARELQALVESTRAEIAATEAALARGGASDADRRQERDAIARLGTLERQVGALRWARRALATWHVVHIPIGLAMFVLAFAHIVAAIWYATLLK